MCKDITEYNTIMRYLMSVVIFAHFQRPSVAATMTLEEFVRGKTASDGMYCCAKFIYFCQY